VATPSPRINLFVALPAAPAALAAMVADGTAPVSELALVAVVALLAVSGALWSFHQRAARRRAVLARARAIGLSPESAALVAQLFESEGPDSAEALLHEPEALRRHLARELRAARDDADAFPGAPAPFSELRLYDPADPGVPDVHAFVLAIDERSLLLASRADCPWPARRTLHAVPPDARGAQAIELALMLRPAYPSWEWVLTHRLVGQVTNRRSSVRVPCRLETVILPDGDGAPALRAALLRDEALDEVALRRSPAWPRRTAATVMDLSSDGARLALRHELRVRQRFHLALRRPDGTLAALPLAEVVSVVSAEDGTLRIGTRFVTLRLRERLRLAEFVRAMERGQKLAGVQG
jgi:hypothetical protein